MVIWNVFGKPALLRCWRIIRLSCHTECSSFAPFGCDAAVVYFEV